MKKSSFIIILLLLFSVNLGYSQTAGDNIYSVNIQKKDATILLYPNPVRDNGFFVKSDSLIEKIELINVLGQTVKTLINKTGLPYNLFVEIRNLQKGMYMVQISLAGGKKKLSKVIIE